MAGKKPTAYLDTTILSSYWYEGPDILVLARRVPLLARSAVPRLS